MDPSTGQRLPIAEAAAVLGLSEKTIRRRIKAGTLQANRVVTPQGHVWLVNVTGVASPPPGHSVQVSADERQTAMTELTRSVASELTRSLSTRIEELVRENEQLRARLLSLQSPQPEPMPAEPAPVVEAVSAPAVRPWWRRWLG